MCIGGYAILCTFVCALLYWQERVVHDSQQALEAKSITASSLRHRLSNLKCTLETELEGVLASLMQAKHTYVYTCRHLRTNNCSVCSVSTCICDRLSVCLVMNTALMHIYVYMCVYMCVFIFIECYSFIWHCIAYVYICSCCESCAVICPEDIIRGVCVHVCTYIRTYTCVYVVLHS